MAIRSLMAKINCQIHTRGSRLRYDDRIVFMNIIKPDAAKDDDRVVGQAGTKLEPSYVLPALASKQKGRRVNGHSGFSPALTA